MIKGKAEFLKRITDKMPFYKSAQSVRVDKRMEGSSPPSVFVGRYGYPKVSVGPLIPPKIGDTHIMDAPEEWVGLAGGASEVVSYRLQLVRGKREVHIKDRSRFSEMLQEVALSKTPSDVEAEFSGSPRGSFFHEELQPFGPSAPLKEFRVDSGYLEHRLEKAYYDTDLMAKDAFLELYSKGSPVSSIIRALSVGALGIGKNRKFVPTRWSITAVDSTISEELLDTVKTLPTLEETLVFEGESFSNRYLVILFPSLWQYEWVEAFYPSEFAGGSICIFGDSEGFPKKREYSQVGGCYYSTRLAVAEKLAQLGRQGGALVLREAYRDYIPLGVWNVRENVRLALRNEPMRFESFRKGLDYSFSRLTIPQRTWLGASKLARKRETQTRLSGFF